MRWAAGHEPILEAPKCARCRKRWRRARYDPFCSFHCQEWDRLDRVNAYVRSLGYPEIDDASKG